MRWVLGLALNSVFPAVPLGTLAANLLGGLTTFSAFTAEIGTLLQEQRVLAATAAVAAHVCGSLVMLFLGMGTFALFRFFFPLNAWRQRVVHPWNGCEEA